MPGFGYTAFGYSPFGVSDFGRYVMYDGLPTLYRERDEENDYALRKFTNGVAETFNLLQEKASKLDSLNDPFYLNNISTYTIGLETVSKPLSVPEALGYNASINSLGKVTLPTGRFTSSDIGKQIVFSNSTIASNRVPVTISRVDSLKEIYTTPKLAVDSGLRWLVQKQIQPSDNETVLTVYYGDVGLLRPGYSLIDANNSILSIKQRYSFNYDLENTQALISREGTDAVIADISGDNCLLSPTALFTLQDYGKVLITGTSSDQNNRWIISGIVNPADLGGAYSGWTGVRLVSSTDNTTQPSVNTTAQYWGILPKGYIVLDGIVSPQSLVLQSGFDLQSAALTPPTVYSASAKFTSDDVGRTFVIYDYISGLDIDTREIVSVTNANQVVLDGSNFATSFTSKGYRVFDSVATITAKQKSLLSDLSLNFGVPINQKENLQRQAEWVEAIPTWLKEKSTQETYEKLCKLSGYSAVISRLYRVDLTTEIGALIDPSDYKLLYTEGTGKAGSDGSLTYNAGLVRFTSPTALFTMGDINSQIELSGAADSDNNKLYTIDSIINENTVDFIVDNYNTDMTLPDANNGSLDWAVCKVYTDFAPYAPNYDEINVDLLQQYVGTTGFHVDMWCEDPDYDTDVMFKSQDLTVVSDSLYEITLTPLLRMGIDSPTGTFSVGQTVTGGTSGDTGVIYHKDGSTLFLLNYTGDFLASETVTTMSGSGTVYPSGTQEADSDVIVQVGNWIFTDAAGTEYVIDTYDSTTNKIRITSEITPTIGFSYIYYDCPLQTICGVCSSPVVLIDVSATNSPEITVDELKERLLAVTPANTTLVVQ